MSQNETTAVQQTFDDKLPITKDYAFCKVMEDNPELCRKLISMILDIPLEELVFTSDVQKQKVIKNTDDGKGIRLDIMVKTTGAVYDIEMQATRLKYKGKRVRYYQSTMDADLLGKGKQYNELPKTFIIFLCPFDAFGKKEPIYRFGLKCKEYLDIDLGTEAETVFVCATATSIQKCENNDLKEFSQYMITDKPSNAYTEELDRALLKVSHNTAWRQEMLTLDVRLLDERIIGEEIGKEIGKEDGIDSTISLFALLKEKNLPEEMEKAIQDPQYARKLMETYGL